MIDFPTTQAPTTEIVRFKFQWRSTESTEVVYYGEAEVGEDGVRIERLYSLTSDRAGKVWAEDHPYQWNFPTHLRTKLENAAREATMGDTPNHYWLPCDGVVARIEDTTQRLWVKCDTPLREVGGVGAARELGLSHIDAVTPIGNGRYIIDTPGPATDALRELPLLAQL